MLKIVGNAARHHEQNKYSPKLVLEMRLYYTIGVTIV